MVASSLLLDIPLSQLATSLVLTGYLFGDLQRSTLWPRKGRLKSNERLRPWLMKQIKEFWQMRWTATVVFRLKNSLRLKVVFLWFDQFSQKKCLMFSIFVESKTCNMFSFVAHGSELLGSTNLFWSLKVGLAGVTETRVLLGAYEET